VNPTLAVHEEKASFKKRRTGWAKMKETPSFPHYLTLEKKLLCGGGVLLQLP